MFDLDQVETVPPYEIRWKGKEYSFEPADLIFVMDTLKEVRDMREFASKLTAALELEDPLGVQEAMLLSQNLFDHLEKYAEQVKKVFGRLLSSTESTDSATPSTQDSATENASA